MTRLYTAKEAAEHLGHLSEYTIRGMCRRGEVAYVKGARNQILFTTAQIEGIVTRLTQAPRHPEDALDPGDEDEGFPGQTSRSRAMNYRTSAGSTTTYPSGLPDNNLF